ncbi:MAG: polyprenyl synthetase family protein [Trueperaceae bacterium]|nr:polyprenyl synthetase family protein [Trueperaceae bacterium]
MSLGRADGSNPDGAPDASPEASSDVLGADLAGRLQAAVLAALPERHDDPDLERFYALLRDYPARGGKRLRGRFVVAATAAHGGDPERALRPAAALELFQNWVLVHDDIEDDSDERRGAPALHRQVGVPVALNVGDAMHVYMWALLLDLRGDPGFDADAIRAEFVRLIHRTAEGQHLDLTWVHEGRFAVGEADYLRMVTLKTSWYTVIGPLRLGAHTSGRTPDAGFEAHGARLGAAFQIRDDVLNLTPGATIGKEFAGDLYEGKRTLVLAHLFAHASRAEADEAIALLARPRSAKRPEDVARLLALIDRHGSLCHAQDVAEREAAAALAGLREVFAALPGRAAADALLAQLATLTQRSA